MDETCVCGAKWQKIKTKLELFGGDIIVNDVDAYYCPECKEELFTSDQAAAAQDKLHQTFPGFDAYRIRKKITKVGNSLTIPISKELADYMGMKKGGDVRITMKNRHRLIIDVA
ncbi:MAG: YgiT-type zinc finger protein [Candidatus Altiarchaeota archaeon]